MKKRSIWLLLLTIALIMTACGTSSPSRTTDSTSTQANGDMVATNATTSSASNDMFTNRDYEIGYDEETSAKITLSGDGASSDSSAVKISDSTITITDEGTYVLTGTLSNGMILIDAEDTDKVQLVLDGVDITNETSAAIYVKNADKVFVTTTSGSENTLTNAGEYVAIDDNNIDAVIFSKSDLTLNGAGNLTINAKAGNGITSKDDLKVTSGTYTITAAKHGLEGKDSIRVANGTFTINVEEDGLHADNDEDTDKGYLYIADGDFTITAGDDGIHASSALTIEDGTINITDSYEGLEGLSITINGGTIDLVASDDGLNAAGGNDSSDTQQGGKQKDIFAVTEGAYITINGGTLHVSAEGDGIDSNGDLTIAGGTVYVAGPTIGANGAIDYNGTGIVTGGTVIAAGASGMAENFGSDSTQGVMMVELSGSADTTITLMDENGDALLSWTSPKKFQNVVISHADIEEGKTYTVTAGDASVEVTMDSLVYGESQGFGGPGPGGFGGPSGGPNGDKNFDPSQRPDFDENMTPPDFKDGEMPQPPTK